MNFLGQLSLFTLGVSSLLPLVNPVGTALIVNSYFAGFPLAQRKSFALTIVSSCLILGVATLFLGSYALKFMGISIPTTQLAGGLIIAHMGISLLNSKGESEKEPANTDTVRNSLFYPMAFPLTLGPGCISALITLSAHAHTASTGETFLNMGVLSLSLLAVLIFTYFCFAYSDAVIRRIGESGSMVLNRLMAFLVFCIGIQMVLSGLGHSFPQLFR